MTPSDDHITVADPVPFVVAITADDVADLRSRLERTRWPDQIEGTAWDYGTDRSYLRRLCEYWRDGYDFDRFVTLANRYPQIVTNAGGLRVHAVHARSPHPGATPLVMVHGWPGSVAEFWDMIDLLIDPVRHGGDAADAFHVITPSIPGYGFSGPTTMRGVNPARIGASVADLMAHLGYDRYLAHGGDWGSVIVPEIARSAGEHVTAIHTTMLNARPPRAQRDEGLTDEDRSDLIIAAEFQRTEAGYQALQSTKPQTAAYALNDSPAGLAGWIVEKFHRWADCHGDLDSVFTMDRLLDNLCVYWFTGTIGSSMRLYYESMNGQAGARSDGISTPTGHSRFPAEIYKTPRSWAERAYRIVYWREHDRGGHFPAMEVPDLLAQDLRDFARVAKGLP